jgi:hypothetical protein
MIGSFHESMISSRHFSSSGVDGNARNSIDENSSYDDLFKEILILRKEKEQDKQTIKLLQEQMVCPKKIIFFFYFIFFSILV